MEEVRPTQHSHRLSYTGNGTEFAFLMLKNLLLTMITFGIYGAWGRTNMRRYIWGHVSFQDDRAAYTGTANELFMGWVRVVGFYIGMALVINLLSLLSPFLGIAMIPLYIYLYALVVYGGTRYRLSRTKWREVHFEVDRTKESSREFIVLVFKSIFFTAMTLGCYYPFMVHHIRKFLTDRSRFGSQQFHYDGDGWELFKIYAASLFFTIITLGIYLPWFICRTMAYRLEHTHLGNVSLKLHLQGKDLFKFAILSYLLAFITLGLATPWLLNWFNRIFMNAVSVEGELDLYQIENLGVTQDGATADVAAVEYDIDFGF
jgi:uncharacterized membrane protein YjgN (DUF898 family)